MRYVRHILLLGGLVLVFGELFGQITFSKRYHFDAPPAIANSLYVTDSCYYFSGIVSDPERWIRGGLVFGRLRLDGELAFQRRYFAPGKSIENWLTPLLYIDSLNVFLSTGRGYDSIGWFTYVYQLDEMGGIVNEFQYRSPYLPEGSIIDAIDVIPAINDGIIVLENNYAQRNNPMGLTEGYNYTLRRLSLDGEFLESNTQEHEWNLFPQKVIAQDSHYLVAYSRTNSNRTTTNENVKTYGHIDVFDQELNLERRWNSGIEYDRGIYDMLPTADGGIIAVGMRGGMFPYNGGTRHSLRFDRGFVQKLNRNFQVSSDTEFAIPFVHIDNYSPLSHLVAAPDSSGYVAAGFCTVRLPEYRRSAEVGWLVKTNLEGDSLWRRFLYHHNLEDSTYYEEQVYDLKATPDGGYLMCGFASERGNPVDPGQQAWFVKVDSEGCLVPNCGLVNTEEPELNALPNVSLRAYPNPGTDALYLHVRGLTDNKHQVQMTNVQGQVLFHKFLPLDDATYLFDVPHYPTGTYFITILDAVEQPLKTLTWIKQ